MNALPGTWGHPDLLALAEVTAEKDFYQRRQLSSASHSQNSSDEAAASVSAPSRCANVAHGTEPALCSTEAELRELTKAICRGDEAAFTRFYQLYNMRLYRHLLVLAKGHEGEAREVLQAVVLKVANRFEIFEDERRLWSWLCRLARNAYVDLCRVKRRDQRFVPLEDYKSELADGRNAEHRLSDSLNHALEQLAPEDGELMRAAYVDRRPLQELAETSGQTYKAMESRLARLRGKLKAKLLNQLRHEERS